MEKHEFAIIILIFSLGLTLPLGMAEIRVEIDTTSQFNAVGENVDDKCTVFNNFVDIFQCKGGVPNSPNSGYWSSCVLGNCELKIRVGNVVADNIPTAIDVISFVGGINAEILVRSKVTPDGVYRNLAAIQSTFGWVTTSIPFPVELALTADSEIYIRLASGPSMDDVDLFDKITFIYDDNAEEVLDNASPLPAGWAVDCEYRPHVEDFGQSACQMTVPIDSGSRFGFWSSCGMYRTITFSPADIQKPVPTSVTVNSFVSGHASLDIWVRVQGVLKLVASVKDTTWTNVTFPLAQFGLDANSEILFEPSSTRYPNHVDLIDKITVSFTQ